jgi:hypothetical protein
VLIRKVKHPAMKETIAVCTWIRARLPNMRVFWMNRSSRPMFCCSAEPSGEDGKDYHNEFIDIGHPCQHCQCEKRSRMEKEATYIYFGE